MTKPIEAPGPTNEPRLHVLRFRADEADSKAIFEALAIRGSGLYLREDRSVAIDDGYSDLNTKFLAAICREWVHNLSAEMIIRAVKG